MATTCCPACAETCWPSWAAPLRPGKSSSARLHSPKILLNGSCFSSVLPNAHRIRGRPAANIERGNLCRHRGAVRADRSGGPRIVVRMPGERVLVTGSAGHLGEALVRVLRDAGREVVGVDVLTSPFTTVTGSIAD